MPEAFKTAASQGQRQGQGGSLGHLTCLPYLPPRPLLPQHVFIEHLLCARHCSRSWEHKVGKTDKIPLLWSFRHPSRGEKLQTNAQIIKIQMLSWRKVKVEGGE